MADPARIISNALDPTVDPSQAYSLLASSGKLGQVLKDLLDTGSQDALEEVEKLSNTCESWKLLPPILAEYPGPRNALTRMIWVDRPNRPVSHPWWSHLLDDTEFVKTQPNIQWCSANRSVIPRIEGGGPEWVADPTVPAKHLFPHAKNHMLQAFPRISREIPAARLADLIQHGFQTAILDTKMVQAEVGIHFPAHIHQPLVPYRGIMLTRFARSFGSGPIAQLLENLEAMEILGPEFETPLHEFISKTI